MELITKKDLDEFKKDPSDEAIKKLFLKALGPSTHETTQKALVRIYYARLKLGDAPMEAVCFCFDKLVQNNQGEE